MKAPPGTRRRRGTRFWLKWTGVVFCLLVVWHSVVVAATGGLVVFRFGDGWEIGSNGMTGRVLWTRGGNQSIAWDCVGSTPTFSITDYMIFVQVPLYIPFLAAGVVTAFLFWRERRRCEPQ